MKIENSVALVTGASRGLGYALVEALIAKSLKRIYAGVRSPELINELVNRYGNIIQPIRLDITNPADIQMIAAKARDVNLLINNAGVFSEGRILEAPLDLIRRDMEVNYFGTLNVIRAFTPILESHPGSAIVNILSISALANVPGIGSYSASKAAAQSLTQSIRSQLLRKSISVHGVFPGPIDTDMTNNMAIPKAKPIDVANAILAGIERGEEDIFPDNMSRQGGMSWRSDPKLLERQLAAT
jgi:NAD(P)-dependent dehydrogenase (short-subunit alcohol dehydrogenase family)